MLLFLLMFTPLVIADTTLTTSPNATTCEDLTFILDDVEYAWYDARGPQFNCSYYSSDSICEEDAHLYYNVEHTASTACCFCANYFEPKEFCNDCTDFAELVIMILLGCILITFVGYQVIKHFCLKKPPAIEAYGANADTTVSNLLMDDDMNASECLCGVCNASLFLGANKESPEYRDVLVPVEEAATCNRCSTKGPVAAHWSCTKCNFDLCQACEVKQSKYSQNTQERAIADMKVAQQRMEESDGKQKELQTALVAAKRDWRMKLALLTRLEKEKEDGQKRSSSPGPRKSVAGGSNAEQELLAEAKATSGAMAKNESNDRAQLIVIIKAKKDVKEAQAEYARLHRELALFQT
jgi:hypothetical protein